MDESGWFGLPGAMALTRLCWALVRKYRMGITTFLGKSAEFIRRSVTWKKVAILSLLWIATDISWPHISSFVESLRESWRLEREERARAMDTLRTRPVCHEGCTNFAWNAEKCLREALEVGVTRVNMLGDVRAFSIAQGTRYFRGCLLDAGFEWEPCGSGEKGCILVDYFGRKFE